MWRGYKSSTGPLALGLDDSAGISCGVMNYELGFVSTEFHVLVRFHRFAITRERAIRAEHQVLAPKQQLNREIHRILIAPYHCNRLIATLPTLAIWAVMHGAAVKLPEVFNLRQLIDEPGRKQKHAPRNPFPSL